jgi:catechol 2,3-dioxygenase-like lactoylglutathione lyase family enzyme
MLTIGILPVGFSFAGRRNGALASREAGGLAVTERANRGCTRQALAQFAEEFGEIEAMTALAFTQQVTFLYVRDLAASERFYGDTLGLELVLNQGLARIYRIGQGNAFLGICLSSTVQQAPPPDRAPLGVIVTFVTEDVDGAYAELGAKGVAFEKAPATNATYDIYNCFFRDPDGYLLEIQKFLSADWPHS